MTESEFAAHYETLNPRLRRMASAFSWRMRRRDEIEDVLADSWLKAWKHKDGFESHCAFYTWMCRIVTNTIRERIRREGTITKYLGVNIGAPHESLTENRAHRSSVQDEIEDRQRVQIIVRSVKARDRRWFAQRYGFEVPFAEISAETGINEQTLKVRSFRIAQRLQGKRRAA